MITSDMTTSQVPGGMSPPDPRPHYVGGPTPKIRRGGGSGWRRAPRTQLMCIPSVINLAPHWRSHGQINIYTYIYIFIWGPGGSQARNKIRGLGGGRPQVKDFPGLGPRPRARKQKYKIAPRRPARIVFPKGMQPVPGRQQDMQVSLRFYPQPGHTLRRCRGPCGSHSRTHIHMLMHAGTASKSAIYGCGYNSCGCNLRVSGVRSGSLGVDLGPSLGTPRGRGDENQ